IIFMILAALVTPPGFQKELPNTNNSPPTPDQNNKKNIDVEVNDKGVIFVDNAKTNDKDVYYVMKQTVSKRGHLHVSITADTKAPYGTIIRILDAAKEANLDDVGFVTS
ncbi:MAG: biopolymer transporter ExbD, partial [Candidatus Eremiobacteraeota bacterium]|nr:biopolymer transporter ExbD [Candidatus Eremiobacteraeota bacterium]